MTGQSTTTNGESGESELNTADMLAVHAALRRELAALPALVARAADLDPNERATVVAHWSMVNRFLDSHHTGEDEVLWPLLRQRRPESVELVDALEAEHGKLHDLLDRADAIIGTWGEDADGIDECVQLVAELADSLRAHSAREESELLPLIPGTVTPEEWAQLPAHAQRAFSPPEMMIAMGMIMEELPPPAREGMLSALPEPARQAWIAFGEAQYRDYADRIAAIANG